MKFLVAYFTQTGNTKMIAEAIHEVISAHGEVIIDTVRKVDLESLDEFDLIFVGSACHDGDLAMPAKGFLDKLPKSPRFKLAGFFTHAAYERTENKRHQEVYDKWAGKCHISFEDACKNKNIDFLGYFNCMGKASLGIEQFIRNEIITDEDEWNEYLPDLRTHPDSTDIENAKKFAQEILDNL